MTACRGRQPIRTAGWPAGADKRPAGLSARQLLRTALLVWGCALRLRIAGITEAQAGSREPARTVRRAVIC